MNDLFADLVQPQFEEYRGDFLAKARGIALRLAKDGACITINDVRRFIAPPEDIDPRVMGAVFRTEDWVNMGYVGSQRRTCHGRPVALFRLRLAGDTA